MRRTPYVSPFLEKLMAKKVVFITGDVIGEDAWKFLRETKAPYLWKPFNEEQLRKEIDLILAQGVWWLAPNFTLCDELILECWSWCDRLQLELCFQ
jgi:hypothetical protein